METKTFSSVFKNFLKSEDNYVGNKKYWLNYLLNLELVFEDWMNNKFVNNKEINDGNPLIAIKFNEKAIRIIQIEQNTLEPKFTSWNNKNEAFEINDELIICIQPFQDVYTDAKILIELFLLNKYKRKQQLLNTKYNRLLNKRRTGYLFNNLKILNTNEKIININNGINQKIKFRVNNIVQKLNINETVFTNKDIGRKYNQTIKIAKVLNTKISIPKDKIINKRNAIFIDKKYSDLKVELIKLKNEIKPHK